MNPYNCMQTNYYYIELSAFLRQILNKLGSQPDTSLIFMVVIEKQTNGLTWIFTEI